MYTYIMYNASTQNRKVNAYVPRALDPKKKNFLCEAQACYIRTSEESKKTSTGKAAQ